MNDSTTVTLRPILAIAAIFVIALPAVAQDSPDGPATDAVSVEELYLDSSVSIGTLATQIRTGSRETRLLAIHAIEAQINEGAVDPADTAVFDALAPAVDEGVLTINHSIQRSYHIYNPYVRREAVRVMALLGTDAAQARLIAVAINDPEDQVRAEALRGIASIARDPDGQVSRNIARIILRERADSPHQELVLAAVVALDALSDNEANVFHPSAEETLVAVASDGRFIQLVRDRAILALTGR